jgi:hypothetical protein
VSQKLNILLLLVVEEELPDLEQVVVVQVDFEQELD